MNAEKIISFVIISYNRPEETIDVAKNILFHVKDVQGYDKELIIINNKSTTSYEPFEVFLKQLPAQERNKVLYHNASENLGVPRGRNLGMQMASGEIMIFTDDDAVFIQADVIQTTLDIYAKYEESENVKIIAYREQNYYSKRLTVPTKDKQRALNPAFFTNYFIGCAHVIKKSLIDEIGAYITTFQYGVEEYDLAYKTIDAGYKIYYSSAITVLHKKSEKGRANSTQLAAWQFENKVIIAYKYLPKYYVYSHFLMWSFYFLKMSKLNFPLWLRLSLGLPSKCRDHPRKVISDNGLKYIRSVKGRLYF